VTALLTDEAVQFYDLSVECGSYCQGGRSRLEPTSWPDDYSVVKYPDHLAAIARYEARLAEAISLMKEAAPAIDTISFALSERFDRFLAVYAKEDKS